MQQEKTNIETMATKDLKPAPYNPRRISPEAMAGLEASLDRFGVVQPIIYNQRSGYVVGGHQRLKALKKKKITSTQVVVVDLDEIDEKALNVALNSPHISGEFTADLQALLEEIQEKDSMLFSSLLLDQLLGEASSLPTNDPEDVPAPPPIAETQIGDIYMLGNHRLICGDSTDPLVFDALLGKETVDLLLTDPPYGVDYVAKDDAMRKATGQKASGHRSIANDVKVEGGYRAWFASWLSLIPFSNPAIFYIFMSGQELHTLREAVDDCGYKWGDYLVWIKNAAVFGRKDYKAKTEWCLQGWPEVFEGDMPQEIVDMRTPEYAIYGWPETHRFYGPKNACTVLEFDRPKKNDLHPTMKPIALLERLLNDGSPKGSIVLDCFGGSGSTLMACETTQRQARLIELDPIYCDVIVKRWETYTGKKAERVVNENA